MWHRIPSLYKTARYIAPKIPVASSSRYTFYREFHSSIPSHIIKPFLLADIGEGIRECEVIQWFVEPGARVQEFDKLCEVQSDKASVEITSRYDGVVKRLYYEAGDMAIVGKPLVDIDMQGEAEIEVEIPKAASTNPDTDLKPGKFSHVPPTGESQLPTPDRVSKYASLATPAVRRMCKEYGIDISQIPATGKEGRVLKEDVTRFLERRKASKTAVTPPAPEEAATILASTVSVSPVERSVPLTPIQFQMFKTMTKSLSIPHFLYTDEIKLDPLIRARSRINSKLHLLDQCSSNPVPKLTYMPFFIKAISLALTKYSILNSRIDMNGDKPILIMRPQHNVGIAIDTPTGLLVPNIKNVQDLSILQVASELQRLQTAAVAGKLTPADLKGGTITISNIGNIGGAVLSPVIVNTEVAILGIGKARRVPMYDEKDNIVPTTIINFSWSADHRVIDGAIMARMASLMKELLEEPELMLIRMK